MSTQPTTTRTAPDARSDTPRRSRGLVVLAVTALLAVLAALLAPAATAAAPAATAGEKKMAAAVENLLNAERRAHHLPAVHMRTALLRSAHAHNLAMARSNTMSHQVRGEASLTTRMRRAGYHFQYAGENIAWNSAMTTNGVLALERSMYGERPPNDGHRLNILGSHYTNVGIDVYLDRAHHKVWLTVDFGRP